MAKVQQVKYLMPTEAQDPIITQDDRPDHRGHVSRLLQRRADERGDLGLSDAGGAAAAVDRRRRRLGRYSRRPDLCDAAVARSRSRMAGARHLAPTTSPPRSAPTISSRRRARRRAISPSPTSTPIPDSPMSSSSSAWSSSPPDGALVRLEDIANVDLGRAELDLERRDERPARGLHRRPGDADRQPADAGRGRARAVARDRAQPAAVGQDEGRLRFDQVHPGLDRRGGDARWARRWSSSSS